MDERVAEAAAVGGFWSIVFSGGWVGVLIVLTLSALSLVAAYLMIEQIFAPRRGEVMPTGLADEVRQLLAQGKLPEADGALKTPQPAGLCID